MSPQGGQTATDHLLEIRRQEHSSKALARVPPDFHPSMLAHLQELHAALERAVAEAPSSNATEAARQAFLRTRTSYLEVVEWRVAKVASRAAQNVSGATDVPPNLTVEERALFDQLSAQVKAYWDARSGGLPGKVSGPPKA